MGDNMEVPLSLSFVGCGEDGRVLETCGDICTCKLLVYMLYTLIWMFFDTTWLWLHFLCDVINGFISDSTLPMLWNIIGVYWCSHNWWILKREPTDLCNKSNTIEETIKHWMITKLDHIIILEPLVTNRFSSYNNHRTSSSQPVTCRLILQLQSI